MEKVIDSWLAKLDKWAIGKLWQVVVALKV